MQPSEANHSVPPFPPFPSVSRYVALGSVEQAIDRVSRAVTAQEGISLVIGPPGTGKSLICSSLNQQFSSTHDVCMLGEIPIPDAISFQRQMLHHLGVDYQNTDNCDLQVALIKRICEGSTKPNGVLLLVDEAQTLSTEVLEAIRSTTNIMQDGRPCVSTIVFGGVKLDETLSSPSMESFTQRVATRCYLHALNAHETRYYISESIRNCGSDPEETITDEAMGAVHHACNGIPRLINQMMTEAIDCAADANETMISEKTIDEAWAKLQQLPSPVVQEPTIAHNVVPVEFGELQELEPIETQVESVNAECRTDGELQDSQSEIETGMIEETPTIATIEPAPVAATPAEAETPPAETVAEQESIQEPAPPTPATIVAASEAPAAKEPTIEEPTIEEPTIEEPTIEEPIAQASVAQPPVPTPAGAPSPVVQAPVTATIPETETAEAPNAASIVWSDEPAIPNVAPAMPMPPALFGEFEQEEKLNVVVDSQPAYATNPIVPTDRREPTVVALDFPEETPASIPLPGVASLPTRDVEAALMDEVTRLNEMATQARFGAIDPANTFGDPLRIAPTGAKEQPVDWAADPDAGEMQEEPIHRDDSDLLIIEDELAITPGPRGLDRAPTQQFQEVDFQTMLANMRNGL